MFEGVILQDKFRCAKFFPAIVLMRFCHLFLAVSRQVKKQGKALFVFFSATKRWVDSQQGLIGQDWVNSLFFGA